ncbi:MAG: phage holin family protein [Gemmatimonadota bacterium]|nr:phage holin family protein [Gemmatimonadota bacterium]
MATDNRSMGELLRVVSDGTLHLVRQEIRLAQSEARASLHEFRTQVTRAIPRAVMALVFVIAAAIAAMLGMIAALSEFLLDGRIWLAAFIVAAIFGLVAMQLLRAATRGIAPVDLMPHTADSLREAAEWIKHPTQRDTLREVSLQSPALPRRQSRSSTISH